MNSCTVTANADQGTRQAIRRIARVNPRAQVIATGCYASRDAEAVGALPGVVAVVPNAEKEALAERDPGGCGSHHRGPFRRRRRRVRRPHSAGRTRPDRLDAAGADRVRRAVRLLHHPIDPGPGTERAARPACSTRWTAPRKRATASLQLTGVHLGSWGPRSRSAVVTRRAAARSRRAPVRPAHPDQLARTDGLHAPRWWSW